MAANAGHGAIRRALLEASYDPTGAVAAADHQGRTPLHWAAVWGHREAAGVLLDAGADLGARDELGDTPADVVGECAGPGTTPGAGMSREDRMAFREALRAAAEAVRAARAIEAPPPPAPASPPPPAPRAASRSESRMRPATAAPALAAALDASRAAPDARTYHSPTRSRTGSRY